jgi:mono/diheme cytochrome c family protein
MTVFFVRTVLLVAALAGGASAAGAADAVKGKATAERWCASCHVVAANQSRASADVPTFASVAARYEDAAALAAFLSTPHARMPAMAMSLSRDEIADLVAYIRTLGPPRAEPVAPPEKDQPPAPPTRG